ncbi:virulence factor [Halanaerobium saccharolyticum]|uniref:Virulence factor n=1 Tax=Halanaerobium saccharolyticum TaxID=43595 RepID=A0A4R7YTR2_9FIRM|nr:Gfo/Idh/MocA family oxidoreductase [Halanaerobium saccharolyticum]RAK06647.1 virulence factor [Halanaerobium saccharolyticum]TDW01186.1 virulence factor [Halanaerobium saccharolyticum]TDX51458.1 virulence factor [Halanaerobium saccharolyticum]
MKIGIIGLGDIAQKAYLPLITQLEEVEPYFCTRTESTLQQLGKKYRVDKLFTSLEELLKEDLDAAFVHAATEAHYSLVKKLLQNEIPTFVDKPISYHLKQTEELIRLAKENNVVLMTGFNRRYVPTYRSLLEIEKPQTIIMEKNRTHQPGEPRSFILDDFIHVIDTISYLMGEVNLDQIEVNKIKRKNKLIQVLVTLKNGENTAVGIMNRDNAITEETLEVMGLKVKKKIKNITQIVDYTANGEKFSQTAGWNKMGYDRGFVDMIAEFLKRVKMGQNDKEELAADLLTHRLAAKVIEA